MPVKERRACWPYTGVLAKPMRRRYVTSTVLSSVQMHDTPPQSGEVRGTIDVKMTGTKTKVPDQNDLDQQLRARWTALLKNCDLPPCQILEMPSDSWKKLALTLVCRHVELSPILGDGLKDQAAAWA